VQRSHVALLKDFGQPPAARLAAERGALLYQRLMVMRRATAFNGQVRRKHIRELFPRGE
jgi:hypothetical protein